jgi:hypothetical protein
VQQCCLPVKYENETDKISNLAFYGRADGASPACCHSLPIEDHRPESHRATDNDQPPCLVRGIRPRRLFPAGRTGQDGRQSAKWVIGGTKNRPALSSKVGTSFNFVITNPQPFATANLAAKVSFSRMVLDGSKLADMRQSVNVTTAAK